MLCGVLPNFYKGSDITYPISQTKVPFIINVIMTDDSNGEYEHGALDTTVATTTSKVQIWFQAFTKTTSITSVTFKGVLFVLGV